MDIFLYTTCMFIIKIIVIMMLFGIVAISIYAICSEVRYNKKRNKGNAK
jgi:hypothetical protein